jgi:hypothetical protein
MLLLTTSFLRLWAVWQLLYPASRLPAGRTFAANYVHVLPPSFQAYPTLSTGQNSSCRRFLPEACGFSFAFVLAFYVSRKFLYFRI